jgi:hypothetical protein
MYGIHFLDQTQQHREFQNNLLRSNTICSVLKLHTELQAI